MTPSSFLQHFQLFASQITVSLLLIESLLYHVQSEVIVKNDKNETVHIIFDVSLPSSSAVPDEGLYGKLVLADPEDACSPIKQVPANTSTVPWIALIRRYPCTFPTKINHAFQAGFQGVIVYNADKPLSNGSYNYNGSHLIAFASDSGDILTHNITSQDLTIGLLDHFRSYDLRVPAVLIPKDDGLKLKNLFLYDKNYFILITPQFEPNILSYLLPIACLIGIALTVMIIIMITKCLRDERRSRRNRLSSKHLKKLTVTKYRKGDHYDVCAICLEDYVDGEKVRELPCGHIYHFKCIDPWLTNNRRVCPVCKAKVLLPGVVELTSDSDDSARPNERTRLVEPQRNRIQAELVQSLIRPATSRAQRRGYQVLDESAARPGPSVESATVAPASERPRRNRRSHGHSRRQRREEVLSVMAQIRALNREMSRAENELLLTTGGEVDQQTQPDLNANASADVQAAHVEAVIAIEGPSRDRPDTIDV